MAGEALPLFGKYAGARAVNASASAAATNHGVAAACAWRVDPCGLDVDSRG